jgi:hypothetical protein
MKGRVGTSCGLICTRGTAKSFFAQVRKAQKRIKKMGKGAIAKSKTQPGIIVVPPVKT